MTTAKPPLHTYPLLFGFGEVVLGRGYVAGVSISNGRLLAHDEGDSGWWLDGVNPGAIADGAATLGEAVAKFRQRFKGVLSEIAEEASDFGAFQQAVRAFFDETDDDTVRAWDDARKEVRRHQRAPQGLRIDTFHLENMSISVTEIRKPRETPLQESGPAVAA